MLILSLHRLPVSLVLRQVHKRQSVGALQCLSLLQVWTWSTDGHTDKRASTSVSEETGGFARGSTETKLGLSWFLLLQSVVTPQPGELIFNSAIRLVCMPVVSVYSWPTLCLAQYSYHAPC